jgi:outer membrane protein assembly factor BamB
MRRIDTPRRAGYVSRMNSPLCGVRAGLQLAPALLLAVSTAGAALDWPRFRGPDANGISRETGWSWQWPAEGPRKHWSAKVGQGVATVVVSGGRVVTTGHSGGSDTGSDTVWCFDAVTGKELWKHTYPAPLGDRYWEGGTTGTPTFSAGGDRAFHLSKRGEFFCLDAASGRVVWHKNLAKDFGFKVPEWGFASSPVPAGGLLLANAGDAGAAFDASNGRLVWHNGKGDAAYATPLLFDLDGTACAAILSHRHCVAVEVATGKVRWRAPFKSSYDTNSGQPVLHDGTLEISAYNVPAVMLDARTGKPVESWKTDTRVHFNAGVVLDGHLFAFHGQVDKKEGELRCLDWKTGATKWSRAGLGVGSLVASEGKLIALGESGELAVIEASTAGYKEVARTQQIGGKCWASPVLANGLLYVRNMAGQLVCLDLRAAK